MRMQRGATRSVLAHGTAANNEHHAAGLRRIGQIGALCSALFAVTACGGGGDATSASLAPEDDEETSNITFNFDEDGPVVGKLRVKVPETSHMILRGTMPVPRGMVVEGDDRVPFAVISGPDPTAAITQVETVTRYPDASDGADVVELIAHVRRPFNVEPGTYLDYEVAYSPHEPEPFEASPAIEDFMAAPGALKLVAHDPMGHRYEADLLRSGRGRNNNVEMLRHGSVMNESRIPSVLVPVDPQEGAAGTLPRMMGVTAFIKTFRRQDYFALDLHVHNAFDGKDDSVEWDKSILDLYFQDLSLRLPRGWEVLHTYDTPFSGPAVEVGNMQEAPIVGALPNGKMHLMHRQSQFVRRMVITKESAMDLARVELERGSLGFCIAGTSRSGDELWSWWNASTARFMPQNHIMPDLSGMTSTAAIDAEHEARFQQAKALVRTGSAGDYPIISGGMGWSHPWGVAYGGMTGGERIEQIPGTEVAWSASPSAYRYTELRSKMVTERQPFALISSSGMPTKIEDHVNPTGNHGSWVPWDMMMTFVGNDSYFGFDDPPTHQAVYVEQQNLKPGYEAPLKDYRPVDLQHLIRYTNDLKTMLWLGNDSLARYQLLQCAELYRMTHNEHFVGNWGYVGGLSLKLRQRHVAEYPRSGVAYGRGEGWGLFASTAAYAMGDDEFRERMRPWLAEVAATVRAGQSECTGNITAYRIDNHGQGRYLTRQSFELSFVVNALESMRTSVFERVDEDVANTLRETIVDAAYSTVQAPFWDPAFGGHMKLVGVGQADFSEPDFCSNLPHDANYGSSTIDHETTMPTWAYAYELTGDPLFLQRATSGIGVTGNLEAELTLLGPAKLIHSAHLLGLVQKLGTSQ